MDERITLRVNGRTLEAAPGGLLLDVLREAGFTAVKNGCGSGDCGACTVLVDDKPRLACTTRAGQVAGREVVTPEGLPPAEREPIAAALVAEGAVQCGFCTPGISMRLAARLRDPRPYQPGEEVRLLRPHLCRCTGYLPLLEAARKLLTGAPLPALEEAGGIGARLPRYRARERVFGEVPYVADLTAPGLLHGALRLAGVARGRLVALDLEPARALPGVRAVVAAPDVPGSRYVGLLHDDWPVFVAVGEEIRAVGDVLAAVAAESEEAARAAAEAIRAVIEPLPPLTTPEAALAPGAPRLHPGGNLLARTAFVRGDPEAALARAAVVLEEHFETPAQEHAFLEPEACLAVPGADGTLEVYSPGQGAFEERRQLARALGMEPEQVRVRLVPSGGAFGGKEDLSVQAQTALLALVTGRPVRTVLTRRQSILLHPKRHAMHLHYTVAADREGHLLLVRARIVGDTGAYASVGEKVLERAATHAAGPYRTEAVDVEALTVYTNNPPAGAFRGFGVPQAAFAIEGMLDRLAERLGLPAAEIRARNLVAPGDPLPQGQRVGPEAVLWHQVLERARAVLGDHPRAGLALAFKNVGLGMGAPDTGRVDLEVTPDGSGVVILGGASEMGQGVSTVLQQMVAEETGLAPRLLTVVLGDTARCPDGGMTTASRQTYFGGKAARAAARRLAADLAARGGDLKALAGRRYPGEFRGETVPLGSDGPQHVAYGFAAHVVFLDAAGQVERVHAVHAVGRAVNPLQLEGQITGAVAQGLGFALWEDLGLEEGVPRHDRLARLGLVRADRMPAVEVEVLESGDPGADPIGVGEIALIPLAPALAQARRRRGEAWARRLPLPDPDGR
ncbi:MAG: selenium-dependent xanthine dehydrogenase [Firmicutes bacterium]|nr:selenium-dependent xanthine dehydrogenase [Bacillota bacterium]